MTPIDLKLVEDDDVRLLTPELQAFPEQTAEPRIFVRAVAAPAGWPWDQTRSATMAARHEAPLPIDLVHFRLKRLSPWRPKQMASFAACYIRAAEVRERFEAEVEFEGRPIAVVFEPPEAQLRRARWSLILGAGIAAMTALVVVSVTGALVARARAEEQLATMERDVAVKLRRAEAAERTRRESAALVAVSPGDRTGAALDDLTWAIAARDPDARIEAWRWDHGASSVRARGEASPFVDPSRPVTRESQTVEAGLWRIAPEEGGR